MKKVFSHLDINRQTKGELDMATDTGEYRKYCDVCSKDKHWIEFRGTNSTEDGYHTTCKECIESIAIGIAEKSHSTNRERNLESLMLARCKQNARKGDLRFDIGIDDIQVPKKCSYLGTELIRTAKRTTHNPANVPSLDRVDNTKGYIRGNVEVISLQANVMKNNASPPATSWVWVSPRYET